MFTTLVEQVREDLLAADGNWLSAGFHAVAVHRFGRWARSAPSLLRLPMKAIYKALYVFVTNVYGIEVPPTTVVGRRFVIAHQGGIVIHAGAEFGDDCLVRQNVTVGNARRRLWAPPRLGNRVELGAGAVILGSVTIGDDVKIGPNAVVMTDVPAGATVFAPSARIIQRPTGGAPPGGAVSAVPQEVVAETVSTGAQGSPR